VAARGERPEPRQVGNRARGDRLSDPSPGHLDDDQLACAALLTICGPFTPMLFMGEEWAASTPFQFFSSHPEPGLGQATAEGRFAEFARMGWDAAEVPDPQDPATFARSKLDWSESEVGRHARLLETYRQLIRLRHDEPDLCDPAFAALSAQADEETRVFTLRRGSLVIAVNFSDVPATVPTSGELLFTTPTAATLDDTGLGLPAHAGAMVRDTCAEPMS